MGLVGRWRQIAAGLPEGWEQARLRLVPEHRDRLPRAATLLGALAPGVAGGAIYLTVLRHGGQGPGPVARLLARLDDEEIAGTLELVEVQEAQKAAAGAPTPSALARAWDELVVSLPEDWTDLLCLVELPSSDDLGPAALALAPLNPSRHAGTLGFRFRVARRFGYGASPEMTRRCLARLDEGGIPGTLRLLEARSDTKPVLTQGPTFVVGRRAV